MMSQMPDAELFEAARRSAVGVTLHGPEAFEGMRKAGRLAAEVLDLLVPEVKPGVTTEYLDKLAYDYVVSHGAIPATNMWCAHTEKPSTRIAISESAISR